VTPSAILEMIRRNRQPQARVASVTAAAAGPPMTITCQFDDGLTFQPLILGSATLPAAGAKALVIPSDAGWVYASTLLTPPGESPYLEQYLQIVHNWERVHRQDGTWYQADHGSAQFYQQGHLPQQSGGDGITPSIFYDSGAILSHGAPEALASLSALGATVQLVDMQIRRNAGGPDLVNPVMYGHTYDAGNPPAVNDPPWAPGFGPLLLPPIGRHETGRYTLPASWVTALAADTIAGIGFWAETTSDAMFSDSSWGGQVVAPMNLLLRVVYSTP